MEKEKVLMCLLNDLEMVAIMIGDIEHFMPGLYQVQRAKKKGKMKGALFSISVVSYYQRQMS